MQHGIYYLWSECRAAVLGPATWQTARSWTFSWGRGLKKRETRSTHCNQKLYWQLARVEFEIRVPWGPFRVSLEWNQAAGFIPMNREHVLSLHKQRPLAAVFAHSRCLSWVLGETEAGAAVSLAGQKAAITAATLCQEAQECWMMATLCKDLGFWARNMKCHPSESGMYSSHLSPTLLLTPPTTHNPLRKVGTGVSSRS